MLKHPLHSRSRRFAAATFVMLTVAGAGIAAWAAQPAAQTQAVHDFHYRIGATLEVDGERQDFALRDWPGRRVGFATTTQAGHAWRVELTAEGRLRWRAPPGADFSDADHEPDTSIWLRLLADLLSPLAPDEML